jgi:hypothetical protein
MDYKPYKEYELHDMFKEPRRIAKNPYKLYAAYMLSCIFELHEPEEDDDDNMFDPETTWGWTIDKDLYDKTFKNAYEQFCDALDYDLQIDVWGQGYSIRNGRKLDRKALLSVFNFPVKDDNVIIERTGILNIEQSHELTLNEKFVQNKIYLEKVIQMAEDDTNDGWDKLTDMEVTMYIWYLWCKKTTSRDYNIFRKECSKDLYTSKEDDESCFNDKVQLTRQPTTQYLFSALKVIDWNKAHHQKSPIVVSNDEIFNQFLA